MRSAITALVIGALSMSAEVSVHVQSVPTTPFAAISEQPVTVEGCLQGTRFKPDLTAANTRLIFDHLEVDEFRLDGEKGFMKALKRQHDGHQDEITGAVIVPETRDTHVKTQEIGKGTRVTTTSSGPGSDPRPAAPGTGRPSIPVRTGTLTEDLSPPRWLRMKVTSLRHLNNTCRDPIGSRIIRN
jgi:hypothetical protein